eukprot:5499211-Pleurochrysis_carterae.AAC.2
MTERIAKLVARLESVEQRVALAEAQYVHAQEVSVVDTWKFVTLHVPAVISELKANEAAREEELKRTQWRVLEALSKLPEHVANAAEGAAMAVARHKGATWLETML